MCPAPRAAQTRMVILPIAAMTLTLRRVKVGREFRQALRAVLAEAIFDDDVCCPRHSQARADPA